MIESASTDQSAAQIHEQLVLDLTREVSEELARMRAATAQLESCDVLVWRRTQIAAHNISARAQALRLGVLAACAAELEHFAAAILSGDVQNQSVSLQGAMIAIDTIDLELSALVDSKRRA